MKSAKRILIFFALLFVKIWSYAKALRRKSFAGGEEFGDNLREPCAAFEFHHAGGFVAEAWEEGRDVRNGK